MISAKPIPSLDDTQLPGVKVNPTEFADTTFHAYSEKLSDDYTYILKKKVLPQVEGLGDVKLREMRVLSSIYFFDHPLTPIDVSEILRYDPATVSRAVNKLVAAGLMERSKNMHDTRSFYLHLTESGQKLGAEYAGKVREVFAELESQLLYGLTEQEKLDYLTIMVKLSKRSKTLRELCDRPRTARY